MTKRNRDKRIEAETLRQGTEMILKMQWPQSASMKNPSVFCTDATRSKELFLPQSEDLGKLFAGRPKIYVRAKVSVIDGQVVVVPLNEVENPGW